MPRIPDEIVDEIQDRIDIGDLIASYVPLKRAGKHFKGLCPFHKEKTPSFHVNTEKQIFHCFGCGAGGGVFSFIMLQERMTFPEAVRFLAEQVHVTLPDRAEARGDADRSGWAKVLESACAYFERTLEQPQGEAARDYLERRGIDRQTRERFRLGAAPQGWDHLLKAAKASGHSEQALEKTGLIIQGKSGYYDRFRERLIFPIADARGRILGFGGRSLGDQKPKYLNSPETPLYQKGKHLFGLYQAKDAIVAKDRAIIVEGYFDCISLVSAGIEHTVAPLGTALTVDQIRLLKRYTNQVVLAFDADAAGEQATLRGIDLLIESGVSVRVAVFPGAKDPDAYVCEFGAQGFERVLAEAQDVLGALLASARRLYPKDTPEDRAKVAQFVLPRIAKIPDAVLRSEYSRILAERLNFEERAVLQDLERHPRSRAEGTAPVRAQAGQRQGELGAEALFTALVLEDPALLAEARWAAAMPLIQNPHLQTIVRCLKEFNSAGGSWDIKPAQVIARYPESPIAAKVAELVSLAQTVEHKQQALAESVQRIQAHAKKKHLAALRNHIQQAQQTGEEGKLKTLLAEYQRQVKGG